MSESSQEKPAGELRAYQPDRDLAIPLGPGRAPAASFDPRTPEGAKMFVEATLGKALDITSLANTDVRIVHHFSHDAEFSGDAEGEVRPFRRIVVFTDDGKYYDCGSMGVDKALHVIALMIGPAPWVPGVLCKVMCEKTRKGKNWNYLYPNMDELAKRMTPPTPPSKPRKGA